MADELLMLWICLPILMHLSSVFPHDGTVVYFLKDIFSLFIQNALGLWTMDWETDKMSSFHYVAKKEWDYWKVA